MHISFSNCAGGVTIKSTSTFKPPVDIAGTHFALDFGGGSSDIKLDGRFTSAHEA